MFTSTSDSLAKSKIIIKNNSSQSSLKGSYSEKYKTAQLWVKKDNIFIMFKFCLKDPIFKGVAISNCINKIGWLKKWDYNTEI